MSMTNTSNTAREVILQSIRANLAASEGIVHLAHAIVPDRGELILQDEALSLAERFCERLASVGGHCQVVANDEQARRALAAIVGELQSRSAVKRIALSDASVLSSLTRGLAADEISVCPAPADLFNYDIGVTTAQAGIAETGTLVLEAESERHRLVSLLPPVHIAILHARDVVSTIGDALDQLRGDQAKEISRAITFVTGPSRTADIELTLTVGVHGPKELYVIVIDDSAGAMK
jgi:L-lactate dehydrogenase complex protein LldG